MPQPGQERPVASLKRQSWTFSKVCNLSNPADMAAAQTAKSPHAAKANLSNKVHFRRIGG